MGSGPGTEDEAETGDADEEEKHEDENVNENQFTNNQGQVQEGLNEAQIGAHQEERTESDENCQAALSIVAREEQETEEDGEMAQRSHDLEQNCLQQTCL